MSARLARRDFLGKLARAAGLAMLPRPADTLGGAALGQTPTAPGTVPGEPVRWAFDVDGDGRLGARDRTIVELALGTERGARALLGDYEFRADVLGRGHIGPEHLRAFDRMRAAATVLPRRPIVMAWHYGWYDDKTRRNNPATVDYVGGKYTSRDPRVEDEFNQLRNEFGITVDMLSWTGEQRILDAYESGYFATRSLASRRFGLLYESVISLAHGSEAPISFASGQPHEERLVRDFRRMAATMTVRPGRLHARTFRLDGRPVIYVFASHLFGTGRKELPAVGRAFDLARNEFAKVAGTPPYLIGDEALFPGDVEVGEDRLFRSTYFDAITRYHHYDAREIRRLRGGRDVRLDGNYRHRALALERRTMHAFADVRNRYSGSPLLVVPSSGAGLAKSRLPTLLASRDDYEAFLRETQSLTDEHIRERHAARLGTAALPAPLVNVGSWNEEFEGHALMPARENQALSRRQHHGFDWLFALRAVYGWNHYRDRPMLPTPRT